ncbi:TM2 domain-containing protein [Neobacillus sp. BF23-41]|uniref:TM2 domain-containing protein n=1 Tax=Neobacillus sp. BF23-41 TaxID=3240280 RepID=UPI0034E603A9
MGVGGFVARYTKNKTIAGILGILLGGIGAHKFYLGRPGMGILYLLFCWTYVPTIIGFIEGILYLVGNQEDFARKHDKGYQVPINY